MNSTRTLGAALAAALALAGTGHAQEPARTLDAPTELHENDIQLAEFEMLSIPYSQLPTAARAAEGTGAVEAARWAAYVDLLRSPGSKHELAFAGGQLVTSRDGAVVDGCPQGDLACLSAFWSEKPAIEQWISPSVANGALLMGAGNAAATEVFALAAGTLSVPGLVVTGVAVGSFVLVWKVTEGMSPEEEAARYGRDIDALLGRTWVQRNLNSYRYTFEGVLRMAWALRDAEDGVVRQQARRILLLEGASRMTANCDVSIASLWDAEEACKGTVVARHMAFRSWLAILGYLNQKQGWGLSIQGTVEDGKVFQRHFPSLGENQHAPAGSGGGVFGVSSFG